MSPESDESFSIGMSILQEEWSPLLNKSISSGVFESISSIFCVLPFEQRKDYVVRGQLRKSKDWVGWWTVSRPAFLSASLSKGVPAEGQTANLANVGSYTIAGSSWDRWRNQSPWPFRINSLEIKYIRNLCYIYIFTFCERWTCSSIYCWTLFNVWLAHLLS